jgi:hypothetical protein
MILSENRYPSRIKSGTGLFGIMRGRRRRLTMSTRTMPAMADGLATRLAALEHAAAETIRSQWRKLGERLARLAARRRLARSIAHLDDRLLADAGLAPEHRGLGDHLLRHFAAASRIGNGAGGKSAAG